MKLAVSRKNLWEKSPRALKTCIGAALRVVPPAFLLGGRFREALRFANAAQWWSAEEANEYQLDNLRSICQLAYERTAYYRKAFDAVGFHPKDIQSTEDLRALPLIDKETVRENLDAMCTVSRSSRGVDYVSTGGSSGRMLRFHIGADRSATEYAYLVSSWARIGYRPNMAQAVFRGKITTRDRNGCLHEYDPILRRHYYSNFHMTDDNIRRYLDNISGIGPCFLHVYPSSVNTLVAAIRRQGLSVPSNIQGILAGSENVYPGDRENAERVLGVRYFSWYGHCEKLVLAAECERSTSYHVWPTYGFCELLDRDGRPVTEVGKRGEIVGTGFINRVMPFIRYRTGDMGVYGGSKCEDCGREHMILTEIEGRWPQGCLVAGDGSTVSMTAINLHDDTLDEITEYQFHQTSPGRATLRVVPSDELSETKKSRLLERMNARLQGQVKLELDVRGELEKTIRGKLVRVIQEVPGVARDGDVL